VSRASDRVVAGYIRLSSDDQNTVITEINNYNKQDIAKKRDLKISFEKRAGISLGPLDSGGCPCCGR